MKTLYESVLSDMEDVIARSDSDIREAVKSFLWNNYNGSYTIPMKPNKDGIFEITFTKRMTVINKDITELTNGLFIFGDCNKGEFDCSHCINLTSLKGCPRSVGTFNCSYCTKLTSLEEGPDEITTMCYCNDCGLITLKGMPQKCKNFKCSNNPLKNLEGSPKIIKGRFSCSHCSELETLKGCPEQITAWFDCSKCPKLNFESLKQYIPKKIKQEFMCLSNFDNKSEDELNEMKDYLYKHNQIDSILM
jgi:hypothetical protein